MFQDLLKALRWAEADSRVKVIVNTGEGKFFCAGKQHKEGNIISSIVIYPLTHFRGQR